MRALTELIDLNRILLNLARSREFPYGSPRHGYDFIAPLDVEGHIDPLLWKKYRDYCRVRRFWEGEEDEVGRLVHKPGGAEHARWVFDYSPDEEDDEAGYKFGVHAFLPGEYVSISGQDGRQHTFLVVAVDPVPQARREPAGDGQSWSLPPARIAAAEHDRSGPAPFTVPAACRALDCACRVAPVPGGGLTVVKVTASTAS